MSELSERKKRILKAIIDEYIQNAEPVGSKVLVERHELGVSSATLRNEMAELEAMGYLTQPHTSAGRIPSNQGYRVYVDELMKLQTLSEGEIRRISEAFDSRMNELDRLIAEAGRAVSEMTNLTSVTLKRRTGGDLIKNVRLFPCDETLYVFVVMLEGGLVKDKMLRTSYPVPPEDVENLAEELSRVLVGITPGDISLRHIAHLEEKAGSAKELLRAILDYLQTLIGEDSDEEVRIDGANKLLYYPEYHDLNQAREMLDFLGSLENHEWIVGDADHKEKTGEGLVDIRIGKENGIAPLDNASFVVTDIPLNGNLHVYLGLLGPTRMDYARASARLQFVARIFGRVLENLMGDRLAGLEEKSEE